MIVSLFPVKDAGVCFSATFDQLIWSIATCKHNGAAPHSLPPGETLVRARVYIAGPGVPDFHTGEELAAWFVNSRQEIAREIARQFYAGTVVAGVFMQWGNN